eukprot:88480-Alexandrium_andersonii.AAC.1
MACRRAAPLNRLSRRLACGAVAVIAFEGPVRSLSPMPRKRKLPSSGPSAGPSAIDGELGAAVGPGSPGSVASTRCFADDAGAELLSQALSLIHI